MLDTGRTVDALYCGRVRREKLDGTIEQRGTRDMMRNGRPVVAVADTGKPVEALAGRRV